MNNEINDINDVWSQVVDLVHQLDVDNSQKVGAFLPLLKPQAISSNFLMLTTNNSFIKFWVESHILVLIKQALKSLYNEDFEVQIEIDNTQPNQVINQTVVDNNTQTKVAESTLIAANLANSADEDPISVFSDNDNTQENINTNLSSDLTFKNFVIGNSNKMAYQMCLSVAENPGSKSNLNPLFIYGKSGVGKTHLLRAIQNFIVNKDPSIKTIYIDAVEFLNDYVEASSAHELNKSSFQMFRNKYENTQVLLIDDIQQLQGKSATLDMFFNIFNNITNQGKQIVISADRAPKNIEVDERYQSRFNNGISCQITYPEIETKLGIINSYFTEFKNDTPDFEDYIGEGVKTYIAENSSSNIRELKSAITKIYYEVTLNKEKVNIEKAKSLLEEHFSKSRTNRINIDTIQSCVESFYKVSHSSLVGKKKDRNIAYARQVAMYLSKQLLDTTTSAIGRAFNRDHSTVIHSINQIEKNKVNNRNLQEELEAITNSIQEQ